MPQPTSDKENATSPLATLQGAQNQLASLQSGKPTPSSSQFPRRGSGRDPQDDGRSKSGRRRRRTKKRPDGTYEEVEGDEAELYTPAEADPIPGKRQAPTPTFILATKAIGFNPMSCCKMRNGIMIVAFIAPVFAGGVVYFEAHDSPNADLCFVAIVRSGILSPQFEVTKPKKEEAACRILITIWTVFLGLFGFFTMAALMCIVESIFWNRISCTPAFAAIFYVMSMMAIIVNQIIGHKLYVTRKGFAEEFHMRLKYSLYRALSLGLACSFAFIYFAGCALSYALAQKMGVPIKEFT